MELKKRVEKLEVVRNPKRKYALVIYDPKTGQPLEPVPEGVESTVWLPEKASLPE